MVKFKKLFNWFKFDKAIKYGLLTIFFQVVSTPITILCIINNLTQIEQGFYYTFISVLAIDALLGLGLFVYLLNFASHEWANLKMKDDKSVFGNIKNKTRLASLIRFTIKFYGFLTLVHFCLIGFGGYFYLDYASKSFYELDWVAPWFGLAFVSGLLFFFMPLNSILEGCGQINQVERFKFYGLIISNIFLWIAILLNMGLWSIVISWSIRLIRDIYFIIYKYRRFFKSLLFFNSSKFNINWKKDIMPTQWKLALSGLFSYFLFHSINPIIFNLKGAEDAGRMGMSLQIAAFLSQLCNKWVHAKRPEMGKLLALKKLRHLDILYKRVLYICIFFSCSGAIGILIAIWGVKFINIGISERIVDIYAFSLILLGTIAISIESCQTNYLRIFLVEKVVTLSIVTSLLMGLTVIFLTKKFGIQGASFAYFFVMFCVSLPWLTYIKFKFKRNYQLNSKKTIMI